MSSVLVIISVTVVETLAFVGGLVSFVLLFREYRNRKQLHLLLFSLSLVTLAAAFCCLFFSKMALAFGSDSSARLLMLGFGHFLAAHLALLVAGLGAMGSRSTRTVVYVLAGLLAAALLTFVLKLPPLEPSVSQILMTGPGWLPFCLLCLTWTLAYGALLVVSVWRSYQASRQGAATGANRFLAFAGALGLLALGFIFYTLTAGAVVMAVPAIALAIIGAGLVFLGAVAWGSLDPRLAVNPFNYVRRSITIKVALFTVGLFWFGAFAVISVLLTFFARTVYDSRLSDIQQDVNLLVESFSHDRDMLLHDVIRVAALPNLVETLQPAAAEGRLPRVVADQFFIDARRLVVRLIDADGRVIFSSYLPQEVGGLVETTGTVVGSGLRGIRLARLELEDGPAGFWVIRAAAPVVLADGQLGALAVSFGDIIRGDLFDFAIRSPSNFGLVADAGVIASAGETISEAGLELARNSLADGSAVLSAQDGSVIVARRVYASDGRPDGFFYVTLSQAVLDGDLFRVISLVTVIALLILLALTLIVIYGTLLLIRPIGRLREAVRKFESGGGDRRQIIADGSPDEIGELARAFNRMSVHIVERTESLQLALREQYDALINTAHEMRTPLNVFRWTVDLMRFGDTGPLNKQQLELVEQLNQTNRRLSALIQNLLDTAKIEQGQSLLKSAPVRIEDVIDEAAGAFSVRFREKDLNLRWIRPRRALPKVWADRERLYQIVANLMSNAVKYTASGGHVAVRVEEAAEAGSGGPAGRYLKVSFEDSGRGIPKEDQSRIFTRFFRARNASADEIEGAGLGLFIVRRLVEMHGGKIWFTSTERVGSTFVFTIPIEKPHS